MGVHSIVHAKVTPTDGKAACFVMFREKDTVAECIRTADTLPFYTAIFFRMKYFALFLN